jgi:hypothetical protein
MTGDGHTMGGSQSDRAPVEQLVMQGAEGDSVGNRVWPGSGPPSDMGGIDPDCFAAAAGRHNRRLRSGTRRQVGRLSRKAGCRRTALEAAPLRRPVSHSPRQRLWHPRCLGAWWPGNWRREWHGPRIRRAWSHVPILQRSQPPALQLPSTQVPGVRPRTSGARWSAHDP